MDFRKFLILVVGLVVISRLPAQFWTPPTPQNESRFIRSYDPMAVVNSFRSACGPDGGLVDRFTQVGSERADGAGYAFFGARQDVEHHLTIEPEYCGSFSKNPALLTALHEDVIAALRKVACTVSDDRLTLENGLQITYRCGERTTGVVTARPPQAKAPGDDLHMVLSVHVDERWAVRRG